MVGYVGMDLRRFLAVVRARWWLLAAIMLVAAALALGISLTRPDRFQASAELLFGRTTAAETVAGGADETTASPQQAATNLALASLDTVAARVKQRFPETTVDELKGAVDVTSKGNSDLVTVTAEWGTPTGAARIANAFADQIVALRRETAQAEVERAIEALNETLRQREAASTGGSAGQAGTDPDEIRLLRDRIARSRSSRSFRPAASRLSSRQRRRGAQLPQARALRDHRGPPGAGPRAHRSGAARPIR